MQESLPRLPIADFFVDRLLLDHPVSVMSVVGQEGWLDPRCLLGEERARIIDCEEGFQALFRELRRLGPAHVPSRSVAARISLLSVGSFKREFPKVTGSTWRRFIRVWRVRSAEVLLEVRRPNIKGIARACGFGSTSSFSRAFRAECGVTPRDHWDRSRRRRHRPPGKDDPRSWVGPSTREP